MSILRLLYAAIFLGALLRLCSITGTKTAREIRENVGFVLFV